MVYGRSPFAILDNMIRKLQVPPPSLLVVAFLVSLSLIVTTFLLHRRWAGHLEPQVQDRLSANQQPATIGDDEALPPV
jgi:hypothetical protein